MLQWAQGLTQLYNYGSRVTLVMGMGMGMSSMEGQRPPLPKEICLIRGVERGAESVSSWSVYANTQLACCTTEEAGAAQQDCQV